MSFPRYPKYKESGVEWLGEVPEGWEVRRFQRCVRVTEGQVDPEDPRYRGLPLIAPNHVESGTGRLLLLESAEEQRAESGKYPVRAGDVVYSKIRPALRKVCVAPAESLCSADMYPLRGHSGLSNQFLFWLMLSEQISSLTVLESQRVAMPKINRESLNAVPMVLPPLPEQRAIAAFLDRETGKIDALVAEQERLIELLREKRQAVISHAVTKGLNPKAPMKDSGIEWLGEVPAHWEVKKLGYIATCKSGAGFPDEHQGQTEHNIPFFKVGDLSRAAADGALRDCAHTVSEQTAQTLRARVFGAGTIVFAKVGAALLLQRYRWLGRPACIDNNMMGMSLEPSAERAFALLLLPLLDLNVIVNPGAVPSINESQISAQRVALPPLPEQRAIVVHLERETAGIDALLTEAQRAIELLQERRSALISAAVTGQIDVRKLGERAA